ncbi:hypothetical protein JNUCC0626_33895 [Lentzea sp. JNUCC 0626]|uniref:hypothetical protein n=1 Tax=Lentzea sp. JNUCC 0626 TaxID=3367513 RepID=UPI0037497CA3
MPAADDGDAELVGGVEKTLAGQERRPLMDHQQLDRVLLVEHGDEVDALVLPGLDLLLDQVQAARHVGRGVVERRLVGREQCLQHGESGPRVLDGVGDVRPAAPAVAKCEQERRLFTPVHH